MGLFGSKKTYVDSVVYNMAGDPTDRTNYLKYLTMNGIHSDARSISETVVSGTLNGPRMNYRAFHRWSSINYPEGMPTTKLRTDSNITGDQVNPLIPTTPPNEAMASEFYFGVTDYLVWAEKWLLENNPDALETEWDADIDDVTKIITIYYEDESISTFVPEGFVANATYFYAKYYEILEKPGTPPTIVSASPEYGPFTSSSLLPSVSGYDLIAIEPFEKTKTFYEQTTVVKSYSDGRPGSSTDTETPYSESTFAAERNIYSKNGIIYQEPGNPDHNYRRIDRTHIWKEFSIIRPEYSTTTEEVEIEDGVIETTVTTIYRDEFGPSVWFYQTQIWKEDEGVFSDLKVLIYQIGTGIPGLDALVPETSLESGYFPVIPLRINNRMVDQPPYVDTEFFKKITKAYKRASGGNKLSKLLDELYDNDDLGDIDYAFLVWGVSLNTASREGKLYIYHYFKEQYDLNPGSMIPFQFFLDNFADWNRFMEDIQEWLSFSGGVISFPNAPNTNVGPGIQISTRGLHEYTRFYDFRIQYNAIEESVHSGVHTTGAKKNTVRIVKENDVTRTRNELRGDREITITVRIPVMSIYFQETENQYRRLIVYGAHHFNNVYNNRYVTTTSTVALNDPDDSGFIIPLNVDILKKMPLTWSNQLCLEGMFIVFNCYKVVKKKWYQTFFGSILISMITMGIGAVFAGANAVLSGAGILGTNVAIGAMFGMTGLMGAIAGLALNSLALAIIMNMLNRVAAGLGWLGAIFSMLVSIGAMGISGGLLTGDFAIDISLFMRAENLLKLTFSTVNAYSVFMNAKTQNLYSEMAELESEYNREKKELQEELNALIGGSVSFDPMLLTDVRFYQDESSQMFLDRTLLSGSEIAQISHDLISDFTEVTLLIDPSKG